MNILGGVIFCLAVGSKIIWRSWWNRRGNEVPTNSWHNIFEAGKHLIVKLVLREELEEPSTGSNYTESFFLLKQYWGGENCLFINKSKKQIQNNSYRHGNDRRRLIWQSGEFFGTKKTPHPSPEPGCLRKDLRFEKTAVEIFSSRLELFLGKCHEIPDAKKMDDQLVVEAPDFWKIHFVKLETCPQEQYQKLENTIWMMTWKFDLTWKKTSPPGLAITTT